MDINLQGKLKIYIAASYPRIIEAKILGEALEKIGHDVISFWHVDGNSAIDADYISGQRAIRDLFSVQQCNLFIEFVGDELSKGGRHAELGLALAWNKKIILIGSIDHCIFTNLPWLARVKNSEELLRKISK